MKDDLFDLILPLV